MKCSLIIVTYNWPDALDVVLRSAISQSVLPNEIIVADDGSTKDTQLVIESFIAKISIPIIHSWQKDDGWRVPSSRNRAIAKSNYEYIVVIDGDTFLHKDFIKDHKKCAKKGVYIQGSRVLLRPEFSQNILTTRIIKPPLFFANDSKNKFKALRIPFLSLLLCSYNDKNINRVRGCNFSMFRSDVIKVNGFNEDFVTWGGEDSEFVQRLFNAGLQRHNLKFSAIQYHLHHKESNTASESITILNRTISNRLVWCDNGIDKYL
jgi:glycosyltransferase involved in cell wall biosynthesis